jgi:FMN-dependent NADH-azoreductase
MTTLLHIDASARPGRSDEHTRGSHSRRLSARFVAEWLRREPAAGVIYRDVGANPPRPVTAEWIHAAFTPNDKRAPWMTEVLAESDRLLEELLAADVIVAGVPMYNFGPPAQFKAYIDNIVRVGRTFGFDRSRVGEPYWPLLAEQGKRLIVLSSRGDYGYDAGGRIAERNHVEASIETAFAYIGITQTWRIAIEYDEFGGERLQASIQAAEQAVEELVQRLVSREVNALPGVGHRERLSA